jgi:hypothetical protein
LGNVFHSFPCIDVTSCPRKKATRPLLVTTRNESTGRNSTSWAMSFLVFSAANVPRILICRRMRKCSGWCWIPRCVTKRSVTFFSVIEYTKSDNLSRISTREACRSNRLLAEWIIARCGDGYAPNIFCTCRSYVDGPLSVLWACTSLSSPSASCVLFFFFFFCNLRLIPPLVMRICLFTRICYIGSVDRLAAYWFVSAHEKKSGVLIMVLLGFECT